MDANDANQNMEILRAFFSQSRSTLLNNDDACFDQAHQESQQQQQVHQQLQQQQFQQHFFDKTPHLDLLSETISSFGAPSDTSSTTTLNMCAPSLSNFSLQTVPSFSLPSTMLHNMDNRLQVRRQRDLTEQERFLIFIKILFKCLDKSDDPRLKPRAKAVVRECTRGNRMGDANYSPLQEAVEQRLRRHVGDLYWTRAKLYYDQYMIRRGFVSPHAESMEPVPISTFV
ncbi:hypothetical protein MPSEU_000792300 [Mayamaea pseudoterrestris]|nr:hypothetical protein MPSEU_000792300 [Mayamaea pseudoterrestris]